MERQTSKHQVLNLTRVHVAHERCRSKMGNLDDEKSKGLTCTLMFLVQQGSLYEVGLHVVEERKQGKWEQ